MKMPPRSAQQREATAAIATALHEVDALHERWAALSGDIAPGSAAAADQALEHGNQVWAQAGVAFVTGADHAIAWWELLKAGIQPERTHYTLARAMLEAAGVVRWVLSPVTSTERRDRAVRLALEDQRERERYEATPGAIYGKPGAKGMSGAKRRAWWQAETKRLGIKAEDPVGPTTRAREMGLEWQYRLFSAFAHGQLWSLGTVQVESITGVPTMPGLQNTIVTAHEDLSVLAAQTAIAAHEYALGLLERYHGQSQAG